MNFLNKCNGIMVVGRNITDEEKLKLAPVYNEVFPKFVKWLRTHPAWDEQDMCNHQTSVAVGHRTSFNGVLARLQGFSVYGHHAVYGTPEEWVLDALRDGARADYWYQFEKEW